LRKRGLAFGLVLGESFGLVLGEVSDSESEELLTLATVGVRLSGASFASGIFDSGKCLHCISGD